jgi:acyl carrier protein
MDTKQTLEKFIVDELLLGQRTKIDPEESLTSTGVIDSLSLLRLISFIEETFNVEVEDTELSPDNFETLNLMVDLIEGKLKQQG